MSDKPRMVIGLGLDLDYLIFSSMSAAETEMDWGEDVWTLECDHKKARGILFGTIKTIQKDIEKALLQQWPKLKQYELEFKPLAVLSGENNWRKDVLETYKANRKGKRKPVGYPKFCEDIMAHYGPEVTFKWDGVEGDDVLGILATKPELAGCDRVIIVSCDKDFNTIPGYFYWLTNSVLVKNTEEDANHWHMLQTLMGDTTDGYGGVPGVGKETALEFLKDPQFFYEATKVMKSGPRKGQEVPYWTSVPQEEAHLFAPYPDEVTLWRCLVSLAASKGMTEDDLLVQAQVARILRASDWDFDTKKPILWKP